MREWETIGFDLMFPNIKVFFLFLIFVDAFDYLE